MIYKEVSRNVILILQLVQLNTEKCGNRRMKVRSENNVDFILDFILLWTVKSTLVSAADAVRPSTDM